jgi:hypothetical protein
MTPNAKGHAANVAQEFPYNSTERYTLQGQEAIAVTVRALAPILVSCGKVAASLVDGAADQKDQELLAKAVDSIVQAKHFLMLLIFRQNPEMPQ